jgi:hypothetical protein
MTTQTIKLTYLDMIVQSIDILKIRGGASRQALYKFLQTHFKKFSVCFDRAFRLALKKGVEKGILIQNKQRFKLAPKGKQYLKKFK